MWKTTASRLSAALLGYLTLIILLLTLNPFYVSIPSQLQITWQPTAGDVLANLLLFLPVGFLFRLTGGKVEGALAMGAGVSLSIELCQLFLPARTSSPINVVCNAFGAASGALIHTAVGKADGSHRRHGQPVTTRNPFDGVDLPLAPTSVGERAGAGRETCSLALDPILGVCVAIVFAELWRQWLGPGTGRAAGTAALATGTWFLLGSSLAWYRSPFIILIAVCLAILSAALTISRRTEGDRRFERTTLRRILPVFLLYLFLAAFSHPFQPVGEWHGTFGFTERLAASSLRGLYPRIEYLTAFTALGYLIAEWRGRDELPLRRDLPRLALLSAASAIFLELLSGFQAAPGASVVRAALAMLSALFGGMVYHLLRAHVRFLLGRDGD